MENGNNKSPNSGRLDVESWNVIFRLNSWQGVSAGKGLDGLMAFIRENKERQFERLFPIPIRRHYFYSSGVASEPTHESVLDHEKLNQEYILE